MEAEKDSSTTSTRVPARRVTPPKKGAAKKSTGSTPAPAARKRPPVEKGASPDTAAASSESESAAPVQPAQTQSVQSSANSATTKKRELSATHLASLAEGREQGRDVQRYLNALESRKPRRGRRRTVASIERRLAKIEKDLPDAGALQRLHLLQERTDLQAELEASQSSGEEAFAEIEAAFIRSVKSYSMREGITTDTWRKMNVPSVILRRGGM